MSQNPVLFEIAYAPLSLTTEHIRELFDDETENGVTCIVEEVCKQVRRNKSKKSTIMFKQFTVTAICKRYMFSDANKDGRFVRYFTYLDTHGFMREAKIRVVAKHYNYYEIRNRMIQAKKNVNAFPYPLY